MSNFLPRRLRYVVDRDEREVRHDELLELTGNVVLLGEAGGGKTRFTEWLGEQHGYARCTARQLINGNGRRVRGNARVLVIDALDEVVARGDGDAVDLVLRALRDADYPNSSCRAASPNGAWLLW